MKVEVKIEGDSDGFIFLQCPYCKSEFKLNIKEFEENRYDEFFCPYCGLKGKNTEFYTDEVKEQFENIIKNYMYDEINKTFGKISKDINRSKVLKMKYKPLKKVNVSDIKTEDATEEQVECNQCKRHMKVLYCVGKSKTFCAYCGDVI